jgi:peptidoglycan/LPS O-acetylase OafA/YrhL
MFFVLSGFWITRMWRRKYSRLNWPIPSFYASRWWRLLPLYLTVNLMSVMLIGYGYKIGNAVDSWMWWVTQPLIAGSTQFARLLPPAWSLDVEMQFYLIAPLLIVLISSISRRGAAWMFATSLVWAVVRFSFGATLEEPRLDLYLWIFVVGCCAEAFELRPSAKMQWLSTGLFIISLAVLISLSGTRELVWRRGDGDDGMLPRPVHLAFFVITVLVGMPMALGTVYRRSSSWDRWLGDLSYPVYMFHWIPREWYYSQVNWSHPWWWNGLLLLTNFSASIVGAILLLQLVDRPAQRLRERWTEGMAPEPAGASVLASGGSANQA